MRPQTIVSMFACVLACGGKHDRTAALANASREPASAATPTGECLAFRAGNASVRLLASGQSQVTFSDGGPAEPSGTFRGTWSKDANDAGELRYSFVYVNPDPGACQLGCGEEIYNDGKPDPERRADACARKCRADARAQYGSETPEETIACFLRRSPRGWVTNCTGGGKAGQVFTSADDTAVTCGE